MHFNETLGPGWRVCSENLYKSTGMASENRGQCVCNLRNSIEKCTYLPAGEIRRQETCLCHSLRHTDTSLHHPLVLYRSSGCRWEQKSACKRYHFSKRSPSQPNGTPAQTFINTWNEFHNTMVFRLGWGYPPFNGQYTLTLKLEQSEFANFKEAREPAYSIIELAWITHPIMSGSRPWSIMYVHRYWDNAKFIRFGSLDRLLQVWHGQFPSWDFCLFLGLLLICFLQEFDQKLSEEKSEQLQQHQPCFYYSWKMHFLPASKRIPKAMEIYSIKVKKGSLLLLE